MEGTQYQTPQDVLKRGQEAIGIPLKEIDKKGRLSTGKGAVGTVIEESWFGYSPNSESEPDFPEAGVELKVTPYKRNKNGEISAKERLVCNIINYMEEYNKTFKTSSFWHKCNTMLLMSYEYIKDVPKGDFHIDKAVLFSFPEEDLLIIEHDWEIIINKVRNGEAHLISEGDTMYLAACTKGADSKSVRQQPFSHIEAKQRAYSLKAGYMTAILNKYIFGNAENEHIIKDYRILQKQTFESIIEDKLKPYYGKTQDELCQILDITGNAKNLNELLLARMLGVKGKISQTDEFIKAHISVKTIRVQKNNTVKESMSFPAIDFIKLSKETVWEYSTLYHCIGATKFMFVIFKENELGKYVFDRIQFWNIPIEDLDEVRKVWAETVRIVNMGVTLIKTDRGITNDLPKQSQNRVAHVRPHGRNADDKTMLPDGRMITKQCFWLNNTYIAEQIRK